MQLETIRNAFTSLGESPDRVDDALKHLEAWLNGPDFTPYRPAILNMIEQEAWELLFDSFYRLLPFGTGGRRGAVGVGPNRINPVTVRDAVQGHCQFLKTRFPDRALRVVLAGDVREFHDLRGRYGQDLLGPLEGISSKDFSVLAAEVYAGNGVEVHMVDPTGDQYTSTPELSFLIRYLDAQGGLNMSASHNHPDDNGAKFYNHEGGQEVPPHDEEMVRIASTVEEVRTMPFEQALTSGLVHWLGPDSHRAYVELNLGISRNPDLRSAVVAFSPLHGTGISTVWPVLNEAGFRTVLAEEQATTDGRFPTVPFVTPNPEVPSAMEAVMRAAEAADADLALGTDPDADRLGLAAPDAQGRWRTFTGNQIGILMLAYLLEEVELTGSEIVIKTEVTSDLVRRLCEDAGVRCVGDLLVGFKYIGDGIASLRNAGVFRGVEGAEDDFLCAMEESHGVLATAYIRDKDAAGGALLLAELASRCKDRGLTLWDFLTGLYQRFGYFGTGLRAVVMEGATGVQRIRSVQDSLRRDPPTSIGGRPVVAFHDRRDPEGPFGPILSETDRASRDVLVFELEGHTRLILRPSGTEPKSKTYVEVGTPPLGADCPEDELLQTISKVEQEMERLLDAWEIEMMRRLGIDYPLYACRFSSMLPLDRKLHFINDLAPSLQGRLAVEEVEDIATWLRPRLEELGEAPLLLPGLEAFGKTLRGPVAEAWTELWELLD